MDGGEELGWCAGGNREVAKLGACCCCTILQGGARTKLHNSPCTVLHAQNCTIWCCTILQGGARTKLAARTNSPPLTPRLTYPQPTNPSLPLKIQRRRKIDFENKKIHPRLTCPDSGSLSKPTYISLSNTSQPNPNPQPKD